ncbi:hypothetical protein [Lewinella cohaerens]|uniref:hypothetical protein n=1 Tax=Lewinella cohaerens TaxID=70995 RepID=UPI00035C43F5|nr:hypothetical protein [Lewinella cohaerens]
MGFIIKYQRVIKLHFWQYHWLLKGADVLVLPPTGSTQAVQERIIAYDLRNVLKVSLTATSQKELEKRGLVFKANTTGAIIVSKDGYTEADDSFRLSFAVSLIDPEWPSYTLTGVTDIQHQVFHLTNFGRVPAARTLLTDGGNETLRTSHFIPKQGRVVRLPQLVAGTATTIDVFDALSTAVTPALSFTFPAIAGQEEYELDCRSLREGLYRFSGGNIDPITQYLGLENQPALIGVVDLFTKDWEGAGDPAQEGSEYDIRLAAP